MDRKGEGLVLEGVGRLADAALPWPHRLSGDDDDPSSPPMIGCRPKLKSHHRGIKLQKSQKLNY